MTCRSKCTTKEIQGNTWNYKETEGNTSKWKEIQGDTRKCRGNTRKYKEMQRNTRKRKELEGNTRQFKRTLCSRDGELPKALSANWGNSQENCRPPRLKLILTN